MRNTLRSYSLPLLLAGLVAGCATAAGRVAVPRDYFPAKAGYTWAYDVTSPDDSTPGLAVLRVLEANEQSAVYDNGAGPFTWKYDEHGVFRSGSGTYILRSPIEAGHRWALLGEGEARIIAVDRSVETPAGAFEGCVVIRERQEDLSMDWWVAPGVGTVLLESWSHDGQETALIARAVLRSFVREPQQLGPGKTEVEIIPP